MPSSGHRLERYEENIHTLIHESRSELGFGSKLFWTAGPPGVGSLAMMREDAQGLLERLIPFESRFLDVLFKPSVSQN